MAHRTCSIDDCERPLNVRATGYCRMHQSRYVRHGDPLFVKEIHGDLEARLWSKVDKTGPGGCWLWIGTINGAGYGTFRLNGETIGAHRAVYEHVVGPIPAGLHIDHLCRVRNCVNPEHLEPVTPSENIRRAQEAAA